MKALPNPDGESNRRIFIKRSAGSLLTLTLVDLVSGNAYALNPDPQCNVNNNPDSTCGKDVGNPATKDPDGACGNSSGTGAAAHTDADGNCSNEQPNATTDADVSCGQDTNPTGGNQFQADSGCKKTSGTVNDLDHNCGNASSIDETCNKKGRDGHFSADETCSKAVVTGPDSATIDPDEQCKNNHTVSANGTLNEDQNCGETLGSGQGSAFEPDAGCGPHAYQTSNGNVWVTDTDQWCRAMRAAGATGAADNSAVITP